MAMDTAAGVFYRPFSGDYGYGGARYFPLHFTIHVLLIRSGMDPIRSGYLLTAAGLIGLVAGIYFLLRQFGVSRLLSAALAACALATASFQWSATTVRGDLLAAVLNIWGLAFSARVATDGRKKDTVLAAGAFALAFMTKFTTLFGLAATVIGLHLAGRRRESKMLAVTALVLIGLLFGAATIASGGRLPEYMMNCASGGVSLYSLKVWPIRFNEAVTKDPFGMALVLVAFGALIASGRKAWKTIPALALLLTAGATVLLYLSRGISWNHLIDVEAVALIFIAVNAKRMEGTASNAVLAVTALICLAAIGNTVINFRLKDARDLRAERKEILETIGKRPGPLLTETNLFLESSGERPYVVDCWSFRVLTGKHPELAEPLNAAMSHRFFRAVILNTDPRSAAGKMAYEDELFWPAFRQSLLRNYELRLAKYGYFVLLPRK
jgi:hypothetical protein